MLSIVIPVLNEAPNLERLLPDLSQKCPGAEGIVVAGGCRGGGSGCRLDSPRVIFRVIAFFINCRSRLSRIATGDQGLFCRQHIFAEMGGYPEIPLMEDVEFST